MMLLLVVEEDDVGGEYKWIVMSVGGCNVYWTVHVTKFIEPAGLKFNCLQRSVLTHT